MSKQQFVSHFVTLMSVEQLLVSLAAFFVVSGPQSAEASVRKLNCSSMQGHALHVEHMNRAVGGTQRQASTSISGSESSQDATKPQTPKNDYSSAEKKVRGFHEFSETTLQMCSGAVEWSIILDNFWLTQAKESTLTNKLLMELIFTSDS